MLEEKVVQGGDVFSRSVFVYGHYVPMSRLKKYLALSLSMFSKVTRFSKRHGSRSYYL